MNVEAFGCSEGYEAFGIHQPAPQFIARLNPPIPAFGGPLTYIAARRGKLGQQFVSLGRLLTGIYTAVQPLLPPPSAHFPYGYSVDPD